MEYRYENVNWSIYFNDSRLAGEGQCSTPFPIIRRPHGVISVPRWNGLLYRPSGLPTSRLGDTTPTRGSGPTGIQYTSVLHQLGGTRRSDRGQGPGMAYCQSTETEGNMEILILERRSLGGVQVAGDVASVCQGWEFNPYNTYEKWLGLFLVWYALPCGKNVLPVAEKSSKLASRGVKINIQEFKLTGVWINHVEKHWQCCFSLKVVSPFPKLD